MMQKSNNKTLQGLIKKSKLIQAVLKEDTNIHQMKLYQTKSMKEF